jgi:ABC-type transport system involved in cytochrome bd biosynthesis fused ATPase/permease subunit
MIADMDSFVTVAGTIAYSAQKPWIMSASVKDNIVFESEFVEERFNQVIHFASLEHDLKILPFGVDTQIGEKGINISGGQKARISLARALYSNRDIYFLDDVLSAVDVHVGDFLMLNTLKGYLKGKTILMPTHAVKYAELAD